MSRPPADGSTQRGGQRPPHQRLAAALLPPLAGRQDGAAVAGSIARCHSFFVFQLANPLAELCLSGAAG